MNKKITSIIMRSTITYIFIRIFVPPIKFYFILFDAVLFVCVGILQNHKFVRITFTRESAVGFVFRVSFQR